MAKKRSTTTKSTKPRPRATSAATGAKGRTKATRKATSKPAATRAKTRPQKGGDTKPKRVGLLDAAAQILAKTKEPLGCKAIVEQVIAQKLWTTRGKTPHATLYTAIIREIAKKGKDARFKKTDRGRFALKAQPKR